MKLRLIWRLYSLKSGFDNFHSSTWPWEKVLERWFVPFDFGSWFNYISLAEELVWRHSKQKKNAQKKKKIKHDAWILRKLIRQPGWWHGGNRITAMNQALQCQDTSSRFVRGVKDSQDYRAVGDDTTSTGSVAVEKTTVWMVYIEDGALFISSEDRCLLCHQWAFLRVQNQNWWR